MAAQFLPTIQAALHRLPIRALVAYTARCARRCEALASSELYGDRQRHLASASVAIRVAEDFARGSAAGSGQAAEDAASAVFAAIAKAPVPLQVLLYPAMQAAEAAGYAVACLAAEGDARSRLARQVVSHATATANGAFLASNRSDPVVEGLVADLMNLLAQNLGAFPEEGKCIDATPTGPLGALWPGDCRPGS